jgi:uncharacterized cupredoxin-like copper-binding protein
MWRATARRGTRCALPSVAALCLSAAAFSGCGVAGSAGANPPPGSVRVTERDFHIEAPKRLAAGAVRLTVHNEGPDTHELIVVREGRSPLPFRRDGLTVDEDAVEQSKAGGLEPGAPDSERELTVRLRPGRYVLFCNMSGHYMGGMHAELVVR